MAVTFHADADQPIDVPLVHDPDTFEATGVANAVQYILTGDPGLVTLPEGGTMIRIKPLSAPEMRAAARAAGNASSLGAIVSDALSEVREKAGKEAALTALTPSEKAIAEAWNSEDTPDPKGEGARLTEKLGEAVNDAEKRAAAEYLDALPKGDRDAFNAHQEWKQRNDTEVIRKGWLGAKGSGWDDIPQENLLHVLDHQVFPMVLRLRIRSEILTHIQRISVLSPLGKA
jgi:hypothetical protein